MANRQVFSSGVAHPSTRYWISLVVEELSINEEENTSEVFFDLRARSDPTWDLEFSGRLGYIEMDGVRIAEGYTNLAAWDGDGGNYDKRICCATRTVKHNEDGSLSIKVKGYYDYSNILISHKWWLSPVSVEGVYKTTVIQTTPSFYISIRSQGAESVTINWVSNIPISTVRYYDNNTKIADKEINAMKYGIFTVTGLKAGTSYIIKARGKSTAGIWSPPKAVSVKTLSPASITSSVDLIFGSSLKVTKMNDSGLSDTLYFYVNNTLIKTVSDVANDYTLKFSQDLLDKMYKLFGNKNTATTKLVVVTKGSTQEYTTSKTGTLTLNGNAKTVHIGVNNKETRGKVFLGVNKVAKKAVVWIGVNGTPRRSI